ncbi:MAG: tetratricopeptide repeat protein, partial [Bacteroidota bacterium]
MSHQRHLQIIFVAGLVALSGCSRKVSGDEESARRLLKNASILLDQGRFTAARDSASKAEELFQGVRSDEGAGEAALMLGDLEGSVASFENAFKDYNASIQHYRNVGDRVGELAAQISTMDLYARMGREEEAFSRGEDLLRLARATHDNQGAGILGRALLPLARVLGKKETVENLLKIQMQEAQSSADGKGIAWLRDQTGITQLSGGDAPLAVKTFTEARSLAEQARDSNLAVTILVHLGKAFVAAGDIPGAITAFDEATQLADSARSSPSLKQEIFFRLGNVFLVAKRPTESIRWFQSALTASHEPGDELARRYALLQMANALRLVNPSSALPILSQALEGLDEGSPASVVAYANGTAGLCELATNQPVAAAASFQKAVDAAEMQWRYPADDVYADCEQSVVGRGKTPWHDEAIDLLLRMGKNDDALAIALRRSAWNLYRDLDRISPSVADQSLKALIDRWHVARARCNGAEEQLVR